MTLLSIDKSLMKSLKSSKKLPESEVFWEFSVSQNYTSESSDLILY